MTNDHDGVRELLAAWAVGALPPGERRRVAPHLAVCASCAAEADRLRATVRLLDGTPEPCATPPEQPGPGPTAEPDHGVNWRSGHGANGRPDDAPPGRADGVLALALRSRRPRAAELAHHAAPYAAAVAGLQALVPEVEGRWGTPVVHDWDAHATVAHLVAADEHLAVRLGVDTPLPLSHIPEGTPAPDAWARRTADVIAHEHRRTPTQTLATWAAQAAALLATPEAADPELAARPVTVMGLRLPVADHFVIRAFEAWIHTDDIGRALGLPVPPPPDEHLWSLVRLAVRILGLALHDAPPVLFEVTGPTDTSWILGDDTGPVHAELSLDPVDFCLLVGGRHAPDEVPSGITGDESAARAVLERAASLAWL
ncbi:maleylpyruvate isomerase family mycothiol-dependent enzyme [Streptomyces caniscabiei]|uniref:Maleylpyruvate isomerase family mycothiol-dependent enzyme n=1 Tax=Streptomyces caniscabiei TaxID=2746961 RepID=A0A927QKV6_9ACTN|nr:maleylpyruvate isomerase family mycothiol-dependent enzyme [Streptomyces caniscabiei]MBD9729660.1 maleylpyruvate isomerase family mycothiol-dependent enzyme [Streptomyces caniscabiei]MDX3515414.1 maleylpyruvate isomerase family mycothiol-dependent enzyme [Streptomyces caniscabiei]MDX3724315.1 maleylpyruvate isomerase family mycothiol-dependent enzyme [Streptomyces caniscabiei]WEO27914.1 maleylpyruvate isomerase family mycothiol-dependent enzyme [Streptomyces caniscabiei]